MSRLELGRMTDRRTLLRGAGVGLAGLAGAVLLGCGDRTPSTGSGVKASGTTDAMVKGTADAMAKGPADAMAKGTADAMAKGSATPDAMAMSGPAHVADLGAAKRYNLVSGWYRGNDAKYWDFGMASPTNASGAVSPAPIYAFATGKNDDGSPRLVSGQHNIIDVLPGQPGYSDLWEVMLVTVPTSYVADSIRTKADIEAKGFKAASAGIFVNCPVVPTGSTLENGNALVQGWYHGEAVQYPDFGMNPPVSIPIWAFATGLNPDGSPKLVEGQRNVIDAIPGQPGYSAFWRVNLVMVGSGYTANTIKSAADVAASGFPVTQTPLVVNCPVLSPKA